MRDSVSLQELDMTALQIIQFRWPESGKENDVTKSDDATIELAVAKSGRDEEIASIDEDKGDDRNDNASNDDSKKLKLKRVDDGRMLAILNPKIPMTKTPLA